MIWTYEINNTQDDIIITIKKNNHLYVSCGFGHHCPDKDEQLCRASLWVSDYHKSLLQATKGIEEHMEVNVLISNLTCSIANEMKIFIQSQIK